MSVMSALMMAIDSTRSAIGDRGRSIDEATFRAQSMQTENALPH
jgi:hypothetical protein